MMCEIYLPHLKICSNVRTLVICLIALAAFNFAPKPAQGQLPNPPENFKLQINSNNLVFTWDSVNGAFLYAIEKYTSGAWSNVARISFTTSGGTVTLTSTRAERNLLVAGATLQYRVRALVFGTWSADQNLTVYVAPAAPTSLSATATGSSITLRWTNPSSASLLSTEVQIRVVGGSWPSTWTNSGTTPSHTFSGLTSGTSYEMRVRATNAADDPGPSASLTQATTGTPPVPTATPTPVPTATPTPTPTPVPTATPTPTPTPVPPTPTPTPLPPAPAAPTNLSTSGITRTSITLNWTKSSGATYYEVSRNLGITWTRLGDVSSYTFTGLTASTNYTLELRAGNAGGLSFTTQISARTNSNPPPPAPAAPTSLSTSGITRSSITLSWTKSSGATFYEVRTGTSGNFTRLGDVSTYTFTGLSAMTNYTLQVRAGNAGGTSATAQATATTSNAPPPPAPAAPTGLSTSGITRSTITLSWTKSSGATFYEVRRGISGNFTRLGDVSTYTFSGLSASTNYTLQVRAGNAGGTSATAQATATTNTAPPPPTVEQQPDRPGRRSSRRRSSPSYTPTPKPHVDTLRALPAEIEVNNWPHGAQGKRVRGAEIGDKALLDHGVVDAVDVWGYILPGFEVCFHNFGTIVFLDAAYSPRRQSDLPSYQRNGMTCTVVLLRASAPLTKPTPKIRLSNCMVRLKYDLNFRATPAGDIIGVLPAFIRLTAFEHRGGWYFVDYHGRRGWVSARYVQPQGDCG